jgi:antitoxin component YwqK of YwqJK toxin-antitoxin module
MKKLVAAVCALTIALIGCSTAHGPAAEDLNDANVKLLQQLIPSRAAPCPNRKDCYCNEYSTKTALPLRYSRAQYCPVTSKGHLVVQFTTWDQHANKVDEGQYVDGEMEGDWVSWHANGTKEGQVLYVHGLRQGQELTWHLNGVKAGETYYKDGLQEGRFTMWHDNGQISVTGEYVAGEPNGAWTMYERDGHIRIRKTFDHGALIDRRSGS